MSAPAVFASSGQSAKTHITALNSVVLYVLTYLLMQGLYQAATVGMAKRLSIPGVWHVSSIKFTITDPEWWRTGVLAVYGAGPAACTIVGVVAGLWFWKRARLKRGLLKLFLLWVALHGCNLVLGAMVGDTFTESGAWYIPSWLFLAGNIPNIIVAVFCGLVQVVFGYFASIGFLQSHDSITLMRYSNRRQLIVAAILVPWIVGSAAVAALKWPELSRNEELHFLTMGLLVVPMAVRSANELFEFTIPAPQKTKIAWSLVLAAGVAAVAWRLVLSPGVAF
ncbi:hypothetical protein [Hymenobacter elongatus]|uniref:Uncharacterized protein n=1 Tax=Hymenobacter elongatus TaxID=877208 RepID=A0A4Z0PK51_9BACT|nr:hypothetical protein [Hymenobacter elongatus]TGE14419.1 hypothetical protein E5J99_16365 [Hymenobacter elongatus]